MRRRQRSLLSALVVPAAATLLFAAGCATPVEPPRGPGFLGDASVYDRLTQSPRDASIFILRSGSRTYRDYQMVMLDPVQLFTSDGKQLSADANSGVLEVTRMFRDVMNTEVGERYPIVDGPGPKTLRLRTAIVGFDPGDETMLGLGTGASLEAEMVDSMSGERIVAAVARTHGKAAPGRAARQRAYDAITYWARLMRDRMDAARR